ncbi:MAG TPA: saccharopine dehydrogenase C-terminal domain-containing protein, partial [Bacteroidota bacterium]|nr:saccharopine dehydrogenase C-terminal domain-containing protein [Bacteroidota bacterium]
MNILVIGSGMMGRALAYDLAHSPNVKSVTLADIDFERAKSAAAMSDKIRALQLDSRKFDDVVNAMKGMNAAVGATSYSQNLLITKAAIKAKINYCDLGGNMDVVDSQIALDAEAKAAGVSILPNCGLAPGMACVIAAGGAKKFDSVDELHIRVGGLPQHPQPPLNYQLVFSAEGLINEYIEPAEVIRNGKLAKVESMTEIESLRFDPPFSDLEAFNTSGGISTLTRMYLGKVKTLDYKTIRYKGHCEKFKLLLDLGFAGSEPVTLGSSLLTTREFFEELLRKKLPSNQPDVVLTRVEISGILQGKKSSLA